MDFVLGLADEYVLDRVYATLIPAVAPAAQAASFTFSSNGSYIPVNPSSSTWAKIASLIPAAKDMVAGAPVLPAKLGAPLSSAIATGASAWPRDYIPRQLLSLSLITLVGVHALYFIFAWLSYTFVFDHRMMKHPRFLKNQIRLEIECSLRAFPGMTLLTLPWFLMEARGHTKLYDNVSDYGWLWFFASIPAFFLFTDYGIYWIHRWEHHPAVYKYVHKPHHKWVIPTPFASHAFHPVDGYLQSLPYHIFIHIFPFHKWLYLGLFVFVNFWTILIHDSDLITGHPLEKVVNGPAHHTLHHMYFTVNYGQYFTWADRQGGSYRQPVPGDDPLLEVLANEEKESKKTQ